MEGKIMSFRRGVENQQKYQMIIKVKGVETRENARSMIDKKVTWKSTSGKEIHGLITNVHGNLGKLRVQFEKGLPGQSVGTNVVIA